MPLHNQSYPIVENKDKSCNNLYSSVRSQFVHWLYSTVHVVRDGRAYRYSRCVESTLSLASKLAGDSLTALPLPSISSLFANLFTSCR